MGATTTEQEQLRWELRSRQLTPGRDLRVGVIGCGYWGPKLARNFAELSGVSLAAASDLSDQRLQEFSNTFPAVMVTRRYQDLLEDPELDAVVVATPVRSHYPLVKAALEAGKHVLVEKPITSRSDHAQELIDLAQERNLTLMVGHTFVYNPAVAAVRDIVQNGELGKIYYLNSIRANLGLLQPDINVLWDLAPHDISMLLYIMEQDIVSVSARGAVYVNTWSGLHEIVDLNIFFASGLLASVHLSWLDPVKQRSLSIIGSQKMLVYDDIATHKVLILDKGVEVPAYSVTEDEFHASYHHGVEQAYPLNWVEPLKVECDHFLDCIRSGRTPLSDGKIGLKVVKILETAQRSLQNGGVELRVEY